MDKEKSPVQKERALFKYKGTLIVVGVLALSYFVIAASMGNLRPLAAIRSESMFPTLEKGDLVLIKGPLVDRLDVGDAIVFDVPSPFDKTFPSPIVHRIIEKRVESGKTYFETKGDNNSVPDVFKVPAENVIGEYAGIRIPLLGHVFMFVQSPLGLATTLILILVWFGYGYFTQKGQK